MTTETFAGGHGAPSTVTFYSPEQKRDPLGMWTKEDKGAEPMDWEKAKSMTPDQWGKLSDGQRAGLLAAVYAADADKKPGASAALAKLQGWVKSGKGGKGGGKGSGSGKAKSDAKKDDDKKPADKAKSEVKSDTPRGSKSEVKRTRVRPDAATSGHRDGYIVGESPNGDTRMRWDKAHKTYVVETKDGKEWRERRRLKPDQASSELAKAKSPWVRPLAQPAAKSGKKLARSSSGPRPGKRPTAKDMPLNTGRVDLTAAAEVHTGAMIALIPTADRIETLAMEGGEEPDQLHMTEIYLGKADDWDDEERQFLIDVVSDFAESRGPVKGDAFSVNMFNPPGSVQADGKDRDSCVVLGIGGEDVADFHDSLREALEDEGVDFPQQHTPRIPHVTLMYTEDADLSYFTDKTGPITFDTIRVAFGGENYDIPLGGDDEDEEDDTTQAATPGGPQGLMAFKFDPNQPRDGEGQWTDGPGGSGGGDGGPKLPKPKDSASLWKNRKDYVGKVVAVRHHKDGSVQQRLVVVEGAKGPVIRRESQQYAYDEDRKLVPTGKFSGEDDGYSDVKSAKKLREDIEDAPAWAKFEFVEPEEAHPNGSPYDKVKPEAPEYVEPEGPEVSEPGYDPSEWDNLPESEAPDGWAEGGSDPELMPKERRATKAWSEIQRNALYGYTVDATTYNTTFRDSKGKKPSKDEIDSNGVMIREATDAIDSAMYPLPRDMTVFRQATIKAFGVNSLEELKSLDGQTVKDFGYVSTSVNFKQNLPNGTFAGRIHIKIDVPKGKKAAYIADVSAYPEQNELLLARNSKMKIQSVELKNGFAFVTMKVV